MISSETYKDGKVKQDIKSTVKKRKTAINSFPENHRKVQAGRLLFEDFSFQRSRVLLQNFNGSLADVVIEDRSLS